MLILSSQSPRRQALLKAMDLDFQVMVKPVDESFAQDISVEKMAEHLAEKKADTFDFSELPKGSKIIACDTVVIVNHEIFGKPKNFDEAISMLKKLSGRGHTVMTGVCIKTITEKDRKSVV